MQLYVIKNTKVWFTISGILFVASIISFFIWGLKLGIDFTGGSLIELQVPSSVTLSVPDLSKLIVDTEQAINDKIATSGVPTSLNSNSVSTDEGDVFTLPTTPITIGEPIIIPTQEGMTVKLKVLDQYSHQKIKEVVEQKYPGVLETKFTSIGPTVGESLRQKALVALIVTWIGMIAFIAFAFRKIPKRVSPWKFGVAAVIALFHDVIIPIGVFVVLGHFWNVEVESFFVTALLTIMGFSVHDTIVVFDRIRENMIYQKRDESFAEVAEKSIHQTMVRSINTSMTVVITLAFLFFFGSDATRWFVFTMLIGVIFGTYSSIFIASPLLVLWKQRGTK